MLYIVGTPIGNVEDTSLRAVTTLIKADVILCEDTRTFSYFYTSIQKLFNTLSIKKQKILPYYKDVEFNKLPEVLEYLKDEYEVCIVSESGMPILSDPGSLLVQHCIKNGYPVTVIPGPTAFVTASVVSGFDNSQLTFLGFMPKKQNEIRQMIDKLSYISVKFPKMMYSFYESPDRIQKTLTLVAEKLPEAEIVIGRELTKKFEEVIRGKAADLTKREYKGELVLLIKI